jgi:hypothetical protein
MWLRGLNVQLPRKVARTTSLMQQSDESTPCVSEAYWARFPSSSTKPEIPPEAALLWNSVSHGRAEMRTVADGPAVTLVFCHAGVGDSQVSCGTGDGGSAAFSKFILIESLQIPRLGVISKNGRGVEGNDLPYRSEFVPCNDKLNRLIVKGIVIR